MKKLFCLLSLSAAVFFLNACAPKENEEQPANPAATILLKDFAPQVINNIPKTHVERAKFDIIDMHAHDYASSEEEIAHAIALGNDSAKSAHISSL